MSTPVLDAAEAARVTLTESESLSRAIRRAAAAADPLERAAANFARGLVGGLPPDGRELLSRYGALCEALAATSAALRGLEDGLDSLRFAFTEGPETDAQLRGRALDELRLALERRR